MGSNPIVQLLRAYGPNPASDCLYDEHVHAAVEKHGVEEINIPAPLVDEIGSMLAGDSPTNVILTGTAGDGKTYHIRRIFLEYLGGNKQDWPGDDLVIQVTLPNGDALRIIRDLSELPQAKKDEEIERIAECLDRPPQDVHYLIAANDGQLLELWRRAALKSDATSATYQRIHSALSTMLREEEKKDSSGRLRLRMENLSRRFRKDALDQVIDQFLNHPEWERGCSECPLAKSELSTCPIQINRKLLLGDPEKPGSLTFRTRLRSLIEIAAANDDHLPLRQIFILVVNILLGDSSNTDAPLLDCDKARERAVAREYGHTNPYDNAMGGNLSEQASSQHTVFFALKKFAIGLETTNQFDGLLLEMEPSASNSSLEEIDPFYGRAVFNPFLMKYIRDPRERAESALEEFLSALRSQRRRLFFQLSEHLQERLGSVWLLSVFHNGADYLQFKEIVAKGKTDSGSTDSMERRVVKGFNRALTGMMTEETERLWLADTVGRSDDPTGRLLTVDPIPRRKRGVTVLHLLFGHDERFDRPWMSVRLTYQNDAEMKMHHLDMKPLMFEYLLRVAAGSLPSSFSRQCHLEVKHFARIVHQQIARALRLGEVSLDQLQMLTLDDDASIKPKEIKVRTP